MISIFKKNISSLYMPKDYSYYFVQRTFAFLCVNQIRSELGIKDVICYVGVCVVDVRQF